MAQKPTSTGAMRYRIEIQERTGTKDAYGQQVDAWDTLATVWSAKDNPLVGNKEAVFGDIETAVTRTHFIIHYRDGLTTADHRILEGEATYYDIMNIHEIGYRVKLLLICEKRE